MVTYIFSHQIGFLLIGSVGLGIGAVAVIVGVIALLAALRIRRDLSTFFAGKNGADLEKTLVQLTIDVRSLDEDIQELFSISNHIHTLAHRGLHKCAMIRFNPFQDLGGNQSFSLALLDGKNNGIVISSLHTREGTRVYSKQITNGSSTEHELTEEEKNVLTQAIAKAVPPAPSHD